MIKRESDSTLDFFSLLIELFEHVFNNFKGNKIRQKRKRVPPEVKMGWGDYTFTKLEMCYARDAIEVSSFTYLPSTLFHVIVFLIYCSIPRFHFSPQRYSSPHPPSPPSRQINTPHTGNPAPNPRQQRTQQTQTLRCRATLPLSPLRRQSPTCMEQHAQHGDGLSRQASLERIFQGRG